MKIVVTHDSPDLDAITSVWLIKKFLPGWENAKTEFVPAGERINKNSPLLDEIEIIGQDEVIHVDTGLGPLDHHQTDDQNVCGASLTWDFVRKNSSEFASFGSGKVKDRIKAILRMVKVVVDIDHFREVFWEDATAYYHDFTLPSILDGLKLQKPNENNYYVEFISFSLDAILHEFENRVWAEKEIAENGRKFKTRWGLGIGLETINDSVIKLAQKMGYVVVVRKDPRKGYVRIKVLPGKFARGPVASFPPESSSSSLASLRTKMRAVGSPSTGATPRSVNEAPRAKYTREIDLTLAYEKFKKIDPEATWYLHVSKKMLLNGSVKNPKMRPTRLGLDDIIGVLKNI